MRYQKKLLTLTALTIILGGCSSVSSIFEEKKDPPLEGERISVLALERTLEPDSAELIQEGVNLPAPWKNEYWPQAGGYPTHALQNLSFPDKSFKQIWSANIGAGSSDELPLTATPIIAENMIFALNTKLELSAYDLASGKRIWETDVMAENEDEPVISGGIAYGPGAIYVTNGFDELLAIGTKNGEIIWRRRLPAPSRAAPTILNNRAFVTTLDNRLIAFDTQTGNSLWEYVGIGETAGLLGAASAAANNDMVIPAFSSGEITALRVENGSVAWSDNLAGVRNFGSGLESLSDIRALPIINDGLIIGMSFSGKLAAIDEKTGMRVWQREIGGSETPWIAGNNIFVLTSDSQLIALNKTNGAIIWIIELQRYENPKKRKDYIRWSGPILAESDLFVTGSNKTILQIDPKTGKIKKEISINKKVHMRPILAQNTMYLLAEDGTLTAYR